MALNVSKAEVWSGEIEDQAGGAADKLEQLARAGASLEYVLARRTPEQPGKGILFVYPIKGAKVVRAALAAGLSKAENIYSIRIEGSDKPGLGARIARDLAQAAISFRGLSAMALGKKFVSYIALDNAADAAKATSLLKKLS
jgi:hypothetical protein